MYPILAAPKGVAAGPLAAASSAAAASVTWLSQLNEFLQLGATAVAIVAGIYAIKWHRVRISDMERRVKETHKVVVKKEKVE